MKLALLFKYINFLRVKVNSERDIFILVGAMLKFMCILKEFLIIYKSNKSWLI